MERLAPRTRRFLVTLLALAFLVGSSVAATHLHVPVGGAGTPSASTDQQKGDTTEVVCPICFGFHGGGGLPPAVAAVDETKGAAPAEAGLEASFRRAPHLAFRSRAPPPG
jgi:hypothetical protein